MCCVLCPALLASRVATREARLASLFFPLLFCLASLACFSADADRRHAPPPGLSCYLYRLYNIEVVSEYKYKEGPGHTQKAIKLPTTTGVVVAHHHQLFVIRTAVVVLVVLVVPFR